MWHFWGGFAAGFAVMLAITVSVSTTVGPRILGRFRVRKAQAFDAEMRAVFGPCSESSTLFSGWRVPAADGHTVLITISYSIYPRDANVTIRRLFPSGNTHTTLLDSLKIFGNPMKCVAAAVTGT